MWSSKTWLAHTLVNIKGAPKPVAMGVLIPMDGLPTEAIVTDALQVLDPNMKLHKLTKLERTAPVVLPSAARKKK